MAKETRKLFSKEQLDEIAAKDGFTKNMGPLSFEHLHMYSNGTIKQAYDAKTGLPHGKSYPHKTTSQKFHHPVQSLPAILTAYQQNQYTGNSQRKE